LEVRRRFGKQTDGGSNQTGVLSGNAQEIIHDERKPSEGIQEALVVGCWIGLREANFHHHRDTFLTSAIGSANAAGFKARPTWCVSRTEKIPARYNAEFFSHKKERRFVCSAFIRPHNA
jgi:hypothetical protein